MNHLETVAEAATHQLYHHVCRLTAQNGSGGNTNDAIDDRSTTERDRGAVSLEQVLWFVAAGVAVAVIAGILWGQIRDQANTDVVPPSAPTP